MARQRKRRPREHVLADIGVKYVETVAIEAGFVPIPIPGGSDYGLDLLLFTFGPRGGIENGDVRVQVKAARKLKPLADGRTFSFTVSRKDLNHWLGEIAPVILVRYDVSAGVGYWVYVQRYFESLPGFSLRAVRRTAQIRINREDVLDVAAVKRFASLKNRVMRQAGQVVRHA